MPGNYKSGIGFIEVIITVALLALVTTFIVPRFAKRGIALEDQLLSDMNNLAQFALTNALQTGKIHRLFFDFKNNKIEVQIASASQEGPKENSFESIARPYVTTSVPYNQRISFEHFYIKGNDELAGGPGVSTKDAWFFIVPEGISQEVALVVRDDEKNRSYRYEINPFNSLFSLVR